MACFTLPPGQIEAGAPLPRVAADSSLLYRCIASAIVYPCMNVRISRSWRADLPG